MMIPGGFDNGGPTEEEVRKARERQRCEHGTIGCPGKGDKHSCWAEFNPPAKEEITAKSAPSAAPLLVQQAKARLAYIRELTKSMAALKQEEAMLSRMIVAAESTNPEAVR